MLPRPTLQPTASTNCHSVSVGVVKGLIRDIDPDAYTKPKLSASTTETKEAKKARREETIRRKAVQEEMSLIAMRVFEKLLARESAEGTIDGSSQLEWASCAVPPNRTDCLPVVSSVKITPPLALFARDAH